MKGILKKNAARCAIVGARQIRIPSKKSSANEDQLNLNRLTQDLGQSSGAGEGGEKGGRPTDVTSGANFLVPDFSISSVIAQMRAPNKLEQDERRGRGSGKKQKGKKKKKYAAVKRARAALTPNQNKFAASHLHITLE